MRPPLDLRLVPLASAAWGGALLVLGLAASRDRVPVWWVPGVAAVVLAAVLTPLAVRAPQRRRTPSGASARPPSSLGLLAATVCLGMLLGALTAALELERRDGSRLAVLSHDLPVVVVEGTVRGDPRPVRGGFTAADGGHRYRLDLWVSVLQARGVTTVTTGRLRAEGGSSLAGLTHGTRVVLTGRLAPGETLRPAAAHLTGSRLETVVTAPRGADAVTGRIRAALLEATSGLPPDVQGLVTGAAVGDTRTMSDDLQAAMRTVGLTHVTAVSGAHVAVLQLAVAAAAAASGLGSRGRAVVTGLVLAGFVLLVRPEPSVLRAASMGTVALLAGVAGRRAQAAPALAACVLVLLVIDPWLAVSFGFALSVAATAAIVLLAPRLAALVPERMPRPVAHAVCVPVAAQAACGPLVVAMEPAVSLWAVPANVLAAPALPPATLLGLATALVAPWWPAAGQALAAAAALPASWVALVAREAAGLPGAAIPWRDGGVGIAALAGVTAAVVVAVLLRPWRPGRRGQDGSVLPSARTRRVAALLLVCAVLLVPDVRQAARELLPPTPVRADWAVVACDVGQGDGLVVRTGDDTAVVVDVGPADGDMAGCLRALGVRTVDLLVLSHFHADHVDGLGPVLDAVEVRGAVLPPTGNPASSAREAVGLLARHAVPVSAGTAGTSGAAGGPQGAGSGSGTVAWQVLWPPVDRPPDGDGTVNDGSVVLALQVQGLTVLALGDLGTDAQDQLARRLGADDSEPRGPVDVLKVAHHGSGDQSPRLARLLAPQLALMSAGADNSYGHPAPSAVALYASVGATVLSTCGRGHVVVVAGPQGLEATQGGDRPCMAGPAGS